MCGIIAYLGEKEAYPILVKGLQRLEYRGYDSAGIAILKDNFIQLNKVVGKVNNLKSTVINGDLGIAHTRWATHGIPNEANAHPHHNADRSLFLVHNGIIENYATLKKELIKKGYLFYSDTDTEVLTKLIDYHYKNTANQNTLQAIKNALHEVVGAYGIVLINKNEEKLYAARKGSPLVLGIGQREFFVSSDPAAFLEHTRRALYLEDDDILEVDRKNFQIHSLHEDCDKDSKGIKRNIDHIKWNLSNIEKNGYEHFMLKEIHEQPDTLARCLAGRIDLQNHDTKFTDKLPLEFIKKLDRVIIASCGTSWHASLVIKHLIEKYSRIKVDVEYASEFRYKNPIMNKNDLFVAISQSGETADTLAALKTAKEQGLVSFGIVNVVGSTISRNVDSGNYIRAGSEIGVASTKAFTGQVLCGILLMIHLGRVKGTISYKEAEVILNNLKRIPDLVKQTFEEDKEEKIKEIAKFVSTKNSCFFLGRGLNIATALEGSLKLKEISYIHSEAFPAGEMKHGPIALIEKDMPIVVIANKNDEVVYDKILSNVQEVKSREGKIIVVANDNDREIEEKVGDDCYIVRVPEVPDYLQAIVNSVPLQLLAYYVAKERGCEIDQPRNLAKSVTVE